MVVAEIGESSSPPPSLVVSEGNNELYDSDMSDNDDLISDPNTPTMPKWESNTIHASREIDGNPSYPRRTRYKFKSSLSIKDPLFTEKCYLIIESHPQTYA